MTQKIWEEDVIVSPEKKEVKEHVRVCLLSLASWFAVMERQFRKSTCSLPQIAQKWKKYCPRWGGQWKCSVVGQGPSESKLLSRRKSLWVPSLACHHSSWEAIHPDNLPLPPLVLAERLEGCWDNCVYVPNLGTTKKLPPWPEFRACASKDCPELWPPRFSPTFTPIPESDGIGQRESNTVNVQDTSKTAKLVSAWFPLSNNLSADKYRRKEAETEIVSFSLLLGEEWLWFFWDGWRNAILGVEWSSEPSSLWP